MPSLYQITEQLIALDELLAESGGDVTDETQGAAVEKWMKEYEWQEKTKVDNYGFLIANLKADMEAIEEEAKRLRARKKAFDGRIERMLFMAGEAMKMRGIRKLEGAKFTISRVLNGGVLPLIVTAKLEDIPEKFIRVERSVDNEKVRAGLEMKDPDAVKIASLGVQSESVRIR